MSKAAGPFNVNENVWVKLTDRGRTFHREYHERRYPMLPYRVPDESANGWSKWQLWVLMQNFGDAISMGMAGPFETTIVLGDTPPIDAALAPAADGGAE